MVEVGFDGFEGDEGSCRGSYCERGEVRYFEWVNSFLVSLHEKLTTGLVNNAAMYVFCSMSERE